MPWSPTRPVALVDDQGACPARPWIYAGELSRVLTARGCPFLLSPSQVSRGPNRNCRRSKVGERDSAGRAVTPPPADSRIGSSFGLESLTLCVPVDRRMDSRIGRSPPLFSRAWRRSSFAVDGKSATEARALGSRNSALCSEPCAVTRPGLFLWPMRRARRPSGGQPGALGPRPKAARPRGAGREPSRPNVWCIFSGRPRMLFSVLTVMPRDSSTFPRRTLPVPAFIGPQDRPA